MPKLAYWNQEEYDRAMHLIQQPRRLQLVLEFTASGEPLAGRRVRVYTARSMVVGGDEYQEYTLDQHGRLKVEQEYGESLIDVELAGEALPEGCGLTSLTFHWYRPGKWYERLAIKSDLAPWQLRQLDQGQEKGEVHFQLSYDPALKPQSAFIGFTGLLGLTFEAPKLEQSYPEAAITLPQPGQAHITLRMRSFFKEWMKNYTKPYKPGDQYPIEVSLTFPATFQETPSSRTDPPFIPKQYDGRVDHRNGNPYLPIPPTDPETQITATAKKTLTLTPQMIP